MSRDGAPPARDRYGFTLEEHAHTLANHYYYVLGMYTTFDEAYRAARTELDAPSERMQGDGHLYVPPR